MSLTVLQAAIKDENGKVWTLPRPNRHHNLAHLLSANHVYAPLEGQGFLLSDGTWADRVKAAEVALASGQVTKLKVPPKLYSEDLW